MSCAPQWPTGTTGAPVARASRATPGLGLHRPLLGVAGHRSLGVEDHARAVPESLLGVAQHQSRVGLATVDRQLAELGDDRAEHLDLEERGLGEEDRVPPGVIAEQRQREHVGVGEVIRSDDHAAAVGYEVLLAVPVELHQRADAGSQDDFRDSAPRVGVAPVCALAHRNTLPHLMVPVFLFA